MIFLTYVVEFVFIATAIASGLYALHYFTKDQVHDV